jgi:hypothetical protein
MVLDDNNREKINSIENILNSSDNLNEDNINDLIVKFTEIISYYNDKCQLYSVGKDLNNNINDITVAKELTFQLRK